MADTHLLPTIDLCGHKVTRLICGGNPFSGHSHVDSALDRAMVEYFTMPHLLATLDACWASGINTVQSRGDRHQMRMYLEHRLAGGKLHWIAQTATEHADIRANIAHIRSYEPIGIYHHGTHTDNAWHSGRIDEIRDLIKYIKDQGLAAGLGTHIPEVIEYAEEHAWETDFYMGCFYNLARGYKAAPAVAQNAYAEDRFPEGDPAVMAGVFRHVRKPCLGFKVLAASRNCTSDERIREVFTQAYTNIKPNDAVVVGMFPRDRDQVAHNAALVRGILKESH